MPDLKKLITLEALQAALPSWLKSSSKPSYTADEISDTNTTNKFVTSADKSNWNAKGTYSKPTGGIPKTDLSSLVQSSLDKADSAVQTETDPTVPTWAKQTNKPSYNADEIDTTNTTNKFVTADEKEQIGTNASNILYAVNTGVKNWIPMSNKVLSYNGLSINRTPNEIQISGTSTKTFSLLLTGSAIEQQISDQVDYVVYSKLPNSVNLSGTPDNQNKNRIIIALYLGTTWVYSFSTQTAMPVDLSNYTYDRWYAYIPIAYGGAYSGTWKPFLKDSSITDNAFVPGALPNSDLTLLEVEDRAALAEEIDAGAKNVLDTSATALKALTSNTEGTWNGNVYTVANVGTVTVNADNSLTVVKTGTSARLIFRLTSTNTSGTKYANMVLSGCPANGSDETYNMIAELSVSPYTNLAKDYGSGGVIASSSSNMYVYLQLKASYTTGSGGITFKPMVCTLADWKVSQKHVPYRVPINCVFWKETNEARSTSLVTTGIKFEASKQTVYRITATALRNNSKPTSLVIKHKLGSSYSENTFIQITANENDWALTACGSMVLGVGGYFEVYVQYNSAASNKVYVIVEELKLG